MQRSSFFLSLFLLLCGLANNLSAAQLEWSFDKSIKLDSTPLDFAVSEDGKSFYVLGEKGKVSIYAADGNKQAEIDSKTKADALALAPDGSKLYLSDPIAEQLQLIDVINIYDFPLDGSPFKGPADAPITIVEFSEFQCPYCSKVTPQLKQVMDAYPEQVKVVFKNYPLRSHPWAKPAALAGLAAHRQGKFWEMHDLLFAGQKELNHQKFQIFAQQLGLDMAKFNADLKNPELAKKVDRDTQLGKQSGVRGTPTLFVNGRLLNDRSLADYRKLIDRELQK